METKRTIRCLKCNNEFTLNLGTDLPVKEVVVIGICPNCGSTIQIHFTQFEEMPSKRAELIQTPSNQQSTPNLSDSMNQMFKSPIDEIMESQSDDGSKSESVSNEVSGIVDIEEQFPSDPSETADVLNQIMKDEKEDEDDDA